LIFTNKFGFQNKKVQTADINPLLLKISSINKGFDKNKKRDNPYIKNLSRLVSPAGFEPATASLEGRCSIQLS
jgi:site-specific DNA recombinase